MDRHDLELLKQFIDFSLHNGWHPTNEIIQGTYVVLDPACVRISVASGSVNVDNDVYMDWLSPLYDAGLAKAAWGTNYVGDPHTGDIAWRYYQHRLLDLLQTSGKKAYFEYLDVSTK